MQKSNPTVGEIDEPSENLGVALASTHHFPPPAAAQPNQRTLCDKSGIGSLLPLLHLPSAVNKQPTALTITLPPSYARFSRSRFLRPLQLIVISSIRGFAEASTGRFSGQIHCEAQVPSVPSSLFVLSRAKSRECKVCVPRVAGCVVLSTLLPLLRWALWDRSASA